MNKHDWFLYYLLTAFLFGCTLFLLGFFPVDLQKGDLPPPPEHPTNLDGISLTRPRRYVSKLVLMIVDGMRFGFLTEKTMPYSFQHCKMKIKVSLPTVTLPRIKSIATGTVSSFIDVILNVAKPWPLPDSLLNRVHERGDKIVFIGDNTWSNLFSHLFHRYEAFTESMTKYYMEDTNITGNLEKELKNMDDWDFLILHYYRLDHIGHIEGSNNEKIPLKLKEMDNVVYKIDKALSDKNFEPKPLFILTADHGMRNEGGHGGTSAEEMYVPLVVTQRNCTRNDKSIAVHDQIAIAATLAVLFDVKIPATSTGALIPELLDPMTDEDKLYALHYNNKFLIEKGLQKFGKNEIYTKDCYTWYETAVEAHKNYLTHMRQNTTSSFYFEQAKSNYIRSSQEISNLFSSTYTRYDFGMIVLGLMITSLAAILVLLACLTSTSLKRKISNPLVYYGRILLAALAINVVCHVFNIIQSSNVAIACLVTVPILIIVLLVAELIWISFESRIHIALDIPVPLVIGALFQVFSLCSTSFIEEEHQSWYYLGVTYFLSLIWNNISKSRLKNLTISSSTIEQDLSMLFSVLRPVRKAIIAVAFTIFVRRLNQTGDKWLNVPDVGDWFVKPENKRQLTYFLVLSLCLLVIQMKKFNSPLQQVACIIACIAVYCYRGVTGSVIFFDSRNFNSYLILPFFWVSLIYVLASGYYKVLLDKEGKAEKYGRRMCRLYGTNLTAFALISSLLHRPHNVFLIFAMSYLLRSGYDMCDNLRGAKKILPDPLILVHKVALTICISKMFFYYQGNSNSLGTVDLNPGFVGVEDYHPIVVSFLLTSSTYFSEIFGFLYLMQNIFEKYNQINISSDINDLAEKNNYNFVTSLMGGVKLLTTSVYLCLVIVFRHHLFIFTVFSPKLLYAWFEIILFYYTISMTNLYFSVLNKIF